MMLLDKETVKSLLDKTAGDYDSNLLAINLLPDDTIFEIVIEETITAEYFDESKQEHFIFKLSYDYFSSNRPIGDVHRRSLETSIQTSLNEQKNDSINNGKRKHSIIDKIFIYFAYLLIAGVTAFMVYNYFIL